MADNETSRWTTEMLARLEKLYSGTKISSQGIADKINAEFNMNFSRNAIIGKINRLELREKYSVIHAIRQRNRKHNVGGGRPRNPPRPPLPVASVEDVGPAPVNARNETRQKSDVIQHRLVATECKALPEFKSDPPSSSGGVTLLELNHNTCRWPLGEVHARPPYMFCGDPIREGSPYCKHHYARNVDRVRMGKTRNGNAAA